MNPIQTHNVRVFRTEVPPEVHDTPEARRLKEATQQFESILWSQIWKQMKSNARAISGNDQDRTWKQMEDLVVSMATEELTINSGGAGLWRMLYDEMIVNVAAHMNASAAARAYARETDTPNETTSL